MSNQQDLFRRLINEEEEAFKEVYKLAYRPVASFIKNHGGTNDDLQDVFQEGLIGLVKLLRKPSFTATASVISLMYAICRNQWGHVCRKKGKEVSFESFPPGIEPVELQETEDLEQEHSEAYQKVSLALDEVGEDCKILILEAYYKGRRRTEIAKERGVSEDSLRIRLFRCMNKLRKILKEKFNIDL